MSNSYVTLWTQGYCKHLQWAEDRGPLAMMFGGPHGSLPSVAHLKPGDWVYPVMISAGSLFVIGRMRIAAIIPYEDYARDRGKISVTGEGRWVPTANGFRRIHPHPGHRSPPDNCIDHVAVGEGGTHLRFDNAIPGDTLATLRFGPKAGREQPLKGIAGGRLMHSMPLQGHYRRLSEESAAVFAKWSRVGRSRAPRANVTHAETHQTDEKMHAIACS